MNLIEKDELREKIQRGDDFKLVMVLGEWAFRAKHIPGSLNVTNPADAATGLQPGDEIVIYCTGGECPASKFAYVQLTRGGYTNVRRYAGGIEEWEASGLPLEGEMVD